MSLNFTIAIVISLTMFKCEIEAHTAAGIIDVRVVQLTRLMDYPCVRVSPIAIEVSRRQKP